MKNPTIVILMLIMPVNALSYGTIIPLLYPYASRFGVNAFGLSVLFASFSFAQFIATPILGRLSDRFGRKPILLLCLLGTSLSLALFASARSATMLFVARILDGITGGNISVAQAVIADTLTGEERTKSFGLLGAAFGFGFLFGPALGGLLSQISLAAPFWFSSFLALGGTVAGSIYLKETVTLRPHAQANQPLFPLKSMLNAVKEPLIGIVLLISLLTAIAQNGWIIGFQTYTVDVLRLPSTSIGLVFALAGMVTIVMQALGIQFLLQHIKSKKQILVGSMTLCIIMLLPLLLELHVVFFTFFTLCYILVLTPQTTIISGLISERTKNEDQGVILGINQSYLSIGQVVGPLVAGSVSIYAVRSIFFVTICWFAMSLFASRYLSPNTKQQFDF